MSHRMFSLMLVLLLGTPLVASDDARTEVVMRMVGHQVLWFVGDSSSVVKPIEQEGASYKIQFGTEFSFQPEELSTKIDSVLKANQVAEEYIVEFYRCFSSDVVHAYAVDGSDSLSPCAGRPQPKGCYELVITLLEVGDDGSEDDLAQLAIGGPASDDDAALTILLMLVVILLAAVLAVQFNRKEAQADRGIPVGKFVFNRERMELSHDKERIELTGKEAELLQVLRDQPNQTVERDDLLRHVWGDDGDYVGRTLDVFISKLRKKLETDASVKIINIRGVGYRLVMGEQGASA